jgi:hypothetical protein
LTVDEVDHSVRGKSTATFSGACAHRFRGGAGRGCEMLVTTHLPIGGTW